jgi:diaminopimelate epimerase
MRCSIPTDPSRRCAATASAGSEYAYDHGIVNKEISAETGAGILTLQLFANNHDKIEKVRVNMGRHGSSERKSP